LFVRREPVALERRVLQVDRRLDQAVGARGAPARDAQRRDHQSAGRRARAARRSVGRTVVAFLATFGDAVTASLEATRRRAAVACDVVAVVALLAGLDLAVAADRGVRRAGERDLVRGHPGAEAVVGGHVQRLGPGQAGRVRDGDVERRGAVVALRDRGARDEHVGPCLDGQPEGRDGAHQRRGVRLVDRRAGGERIRLQDGDRRDLDRVAIGEPRVHLVRTDGHIEGAAPVDLPVVVAAGVAVDAGLRPEREAAAHLAVRELDLPLGHARVAGLPAREEQQATRERDHLALRVAPAAGLPILRAGVALLGTFDLAVAAGLYLAARAAAVARDGVAVVTLLAGIQVAVAADRGRCGTRRQGRVHRLD